LTVGHHRKECNAESCEGQRASDGAESYLERSGSAVAVWKRKGTAYVGTKGCKRNKGWVTQKKRHVKQKGFWTAVLGLKKRKMDEGGSVAQKRLKRCGVGNQKKGTRCNGTKKK